MPNFRYSKFDGSEPFSPQSADEMFDQLSQYLMQYGEDVLDNLERLEEEHPDLVDAMVKRGLVEKDEDGKYSVTPKGVRRVEMKSLDSLFDVHKKDSFGRHETDARGPGETRHDESRPYQFGDPVSDLDGHATLKNALARQGGGTPIGITEDDLVVHEREYQTSCATVLLLDMSGSMTRYGKYGSAKQVAMAVQSLVRTKYRGDFFQVVGFYSYASPLTERELLYSAPKEVSIYDPRVKLKIDLDNPPGFVPEHFTNIHAGLQFAKRLLGRQQAANKQIIVVTDGEPTAHMEGRQLHLVYPPSERTAAVTLAEARRVARSGIEVSSFALVENQFYFGLVNFVEQMAAVTGGLAAYCNADDLGGMVIESFRRGRRTKRAG
ncbi:MAG: VWA domain-containing protein [Planctomycetota bacterium]